MNIGRVGLKENNLYIYIIYMLPNYKPNNPNIFKPLPTNPVVVTYPSQEVLDKITSAMNLISNGVVVAGKRGAFTKQEASMLTKAMNTLTTHPDTWS